MEAVATKPRRITMTKAQLLAEASQKGIEVSPIMSKEEMARSLNVDRPLNEPTKFSGEY